MSDEVLNRLFAHMRWWGEPWPSAEMRAPICQDEAAHGPVPLGQRCVHCGELIDADDQGVTYTGGRDHAHKECTTRSVTGCPAALLGGPHDHSASYRDQAREVERVLASAGAVWLPSDVIWRTP